LKNCLHPKLLLLDFAKVLCRIPVSAPLTPTTFINFILRNFYNRAIQLKGEKLISISSYRFDNCITEAEKKILHLSIE
ncbi:MAG: DUF2290 domain-containing protein, partial [Ignavibacteria bacterium]|nr:DUF2290 domain-containing protein [Ignavibacteria bacterium]